ncbi:MAG: DUF1648 domain-containing protein [Eudoraea sp.]|nr:DUF1648 domain-containing protein [Eudoraea sp.]
MGQHLAESPASMPMGRTDKLLELIGILAFIFLIGMPLLYYNDLPEAIPRNYGFDGIPDGFGNKSVIWWASCIGIAMYAALFFLERLLRNPKKLRVKKDSSNFEGHRLIMIQWLQFIRLFIICLFAYMIYITINTAMGNTPGFNPFFIPVVIGIVLGSTIYFGYLAIKLSR